MGRTPAGASRRAALVSGVLCSLALLSCGGDDEATSPETLRQHLLPASELSGFTSERKLDFDNPIDFAHRAIPVPESTVLSESVDVFEKAGFEAAVSEVFIRGEGLHAAMVVAEFGSDDGAREALDQVRGELMKQPCLAVCSVDGSEFAVTEIPDAKGVSLTPLSDPPEGAPPPFEAHGIGFTIGPRLYLVNGDGAPGEVKRTDVLAAARALYERNAEGE